MSDSTDPQPWAYWREQIAERRVDPDLPWRDADVLVLVQSLVTAHEDALATADPAPGVASLLAELDACKPLMNGTGPAQGGRTFSGWEVPDWLMKRARDAIRGRAVLDPIRAAIEVAGPRPDIHLSILERHRREWPALWRAIDAALGVKR